MLLLRVNAYTCIFQIDMQMLLVRSGHDNMIQISCNWLNNYIHEFWMCLYKFIKRFTTVVMNGRIMTFLIVQILPFTPSRSSSGVFWTFTSIRFGNYSAEVYLFPGFPSLLQFFLGHSNKQIDGYIISFFMM